MKKSIFAMAALLPMAACQQNANKETMTEQREKQSSMTDSLAFKKQAFEATADSQKKKIYADGIDAVLKSGVLQRAKNINDIAPAFSLRNATSTEVRLADYLAQGPVVLTWYRGGWCPYCNITLYYLQQRLPEIKALGANLLALTPELPDQSLATQDKHDLQFEVLSDVGNMVAKDYGIVFKLTPEVAEAYNKAFELNKVNGDTSNELPLAATYIIDKDGHIRYTFLDADYRNRADVDTIIAELKKLQ